MVCQIFHLLGIIEVKFLSEAAGFVGVIWKKFRLWGIEKNSTTWCEIDKLLIFVDFKGKGEELIPDGPGGHQTPFPKVLKGINKKISIGFIKISQIGA